ncbi:MAG: hypothetical protein JXB26_12400 [Candidatus Aminicenantes bacterium]|nr:hypothetical protein [Candidatus Aminicenantes bacterium]
MFEKIGIDTVKNSSGNFTGMESRPKGIIFYVANNFHQFKNIGHGIFSINFHSIAIAAYNHKTHKNNFAFHFIFPHNQYA